MESNPLINSNQSSPIYIKTSGYKQFYKLKKEEFTYINNEEERYEENCIIHNEVRPENKDYQIFLEKFRHSYKSTKLSISDKNLLFRLNEAMCDFLFDVTRTGELTDLVNAMQIRQALNRKIKMLSRTYVGENAETYFKSWQALYENPEAVLMHHKQYANSGLFFPPYNEDERIVSFYFIHDVLFDVQETISKEQTENEIIIKIQGKLLPSHENDIYQDIANQRGFSLLLDDMPMLDVYDGLYILNNNGTVKNASLTLMFTFGDSYKKLLNYELKSIRHEEI